MQLHHQFLLSLPREPLQVQALSAKVCDCEQQRPTLANVSGKGVYWKAVRGFPTES